MYSQVTIQTSDGKKLTGNLFEVGNPKGLVAYFHMMSATKESYTSLAEKLQDMGYTGIAMDFRGHGCSEGGPEGYLDFTDEQHQDKINDIKAAVKFIRGYHVKALPVCLIGASIGANLSLWMATEDMGVKKIILLSPGLNYRGINSRSLITKIPTSTEILFAGSEDDNYTVEGIQELFGLAPEGVRRQKIIFKDAGHGTAMCERHPELVENIINFIKS
jgi:alpha-beta hydrolase superfamily lysophospholipase